jgi:uncharacterized protein (UPF0264 family)
MRKRLAIVLAGFTLVALGAGIVLAGSPKGSSTNYAIPWDVVSAGGKEMASPNYAIKGTTGQMSIGPGSSSSYAIGAGYWYNWDERLFKIFLPLILKNRTS